MSCRYRSGVMLIVTVVIIWVTSAEVTQGVFEDYKQPFAVTYLGTSLLAVYLPIAYFKDWLLRILKGRHSSDSSHSGQATDTMATESPDSAPINCGVPSVIEPGKQGFKTDLNFLEEGKAFVFQCKDGEGIIKDETEMDMKQVVKAALTIAPIWFISEYLMNAALARTSVASTMIMFSTSGLFTLLIGAFMGQESINALKVISVIVSIAGVSMTTIGQSSSSTDNNSGSSNSKNSILIGNAFALLSAATDGLFAVLLKRFVGEGDRVDMQKLFGCIGLVSLGSLWWLAFPLIALGVEPKLTLPKSASVGGVVVANSVVGSFISDYFWALGVIWTSPLVAALGGSLTIPFAMVEDALIRGRSFSVIYIIGSLQVFLGFVLANITDQFSPKLILQFFDSKLRF